MAYRTVKQTSEAEIVIKRSRFIGRCFPVVDEQEALRLLEQVRKRHWDATHNCFAYSIGRTGGCARFSDDGEPSGTAGLPMLETLRHIGVTDVLVVVTRYFGGILLGAGGLVRAYARATAAAVRAAGQIEMRDCRLLTVDVPYALWGRVEPLLREGGQQEDVQYAEAVAAAIWVPTEATAALCEKITDRTDGKVAPRLGAETVRAFAVTVDIPCEEAEEE